MKSGPDGALQRAYDIHETLGHGPSGIVYRATGKQIGKASSSETGKEVAIKVVALEKAVGEDSLLRDLNATNPIHAASSLRHPGIVRVGRIDTIEGNSVLEMEYVRGMSLRDLLGIVGRLLPERAVPLASQFIDALAYAHARGVLHRNLKPTNLLIRNDGMVKVTDFGYRQVRPNPHSVFASPVFAYLAPEELEPDCVPDRRSDIWSIGVILFQALTGRLPFPISDPHDLRAWQRGLAAHTPARVSDLIPVLPDLDQIVERCLQRDRSQRFATAGELLTALIDTGLCAGMIDAEEEYQERIESTCRSIDRRLREEMGADEEPSLLDLVNAFSRNNPAWQDNENLLRYADVLERATIESESVAPNAIHLTPEEIEHLEEIETNLKSLLAAGREATLPESELPVASPYAGETDAAPKTQPGSAPSISGDPVPADTVRKTELQPGATSIAPTGETVTGRSETGSERRFEIRVNDADGAEMVYIPASEFIMGSNGYSEDNTPQRTVQLTGYYIYRRPVTVAQYRRYCELTGNLMPKEFWTWDEADPIVGVTWLDACLYAEWAGGSLPTEAQWEKAARGKHGSVFPWGDQFDQRSDHRLVPRNANRTVPVGLYTAGASPYGVLDMVGNVQQWCRDLYDEDYYKSAPNSDPPGPTSSNKPRVARSTLVQKLFSKSVQPSSRRTEYRSVRGSSWKDSHESFAFTFRRDCCPAELRFPWVGFRCVLPRDS